MNRREWILKTGKTIGAAFLLSGASMFITGCNVYDDLNNWITIGITSLNGIVKILVANGITPVAGIVNAILGALNAVKDGIAEYKSTVPPPVGTVAKIETALKDAVDQFGVFLRNLNIPGFGLFSLIAELVGIILSTIAGFQNRLPASVAGNVNTVMMMAKSTGRAIIPKHRTIRAFKKDWNAVLDNAHSLEVTVPPTAYHKISLLEHL